jgi:benzoylformate decarboxylase
VADVAAACRALAARVPERHVVAGAGADACAGSAMQRPAAPAPPGPGEPLRAGHVLAELGARLPADAVLVEETPSSRPELHEWIPARAPLGFVSNANGGLGFGLSGAIGLRMGLPERPVVAVVGDGSAMYAIQSLWSAAKYGVGVLFVAMANGGYAVMDQLAAVRGGRGAWPGFGSIDIAGISRCLGCPAVRVETYRELVWQLDEVVPGLAGRGEPLVLEVALAP